MIKWEKIEPEYVVPKSPQAQEQIIPARYFRAGYNTNEPSIPLWKEVRNAIARPAGGCCMYSIGKKGWVLDYCVITDVELATRIAHLIISRNLTETCLRHHLIRHTGLAI